MPELPEVETVCRGIAPILEGRTLTDLVIRRPNLRLPFPEGMAEKLKSQVITTVGRRAKYILVRFANGAVLLIHLGMSGRMTIHDSGDAPEPGKHDHVDFITDGGKTLRFNDPRRFGLMALATEETLEGHRLLAGLGPEPLSNRFNGDFLVSALKTRGQPIKAALLDQTLVAGLGNIYVCESLFRSGISPRRKASTISGKKIRLLATTIVEVLREAIEAGGSSLKDHRQASGEIGYFQHNFAVYGREGEPCPDCTCDWQKNGGIKRIVQGGRSTFFCTNRQR
jgi:formamidopyrimidine-DNA glycosylase